MIAAQEARKRTVCKIQHLASIEMAEIERLIENAIENCEYSVSQDGVLSRSCKEHLESLGYKVETGTQYNESWYCIKW